MKQNYEVPLVETVIIRNKETICQVSGGELNAVRGGGIDGGYQYDDDSD